ncbi:MAG: hypothetical protein E6J91_20865 [Deltaproteobacteria bacterium]|nr:MAG: hypothetical protein E6J91_20865 [Deltaproteobacteria bacterium]
MAELQPSEVLCIPKRKRLTHGRFKNEEGQEVLHLFYGEVELIFDEPDIAPLGEKLLTVERFRAEEAMAWSNGAPHEWEKVRDLLEALIDQQVLKRVSDSPTGAAEALPQRLGLAPEDRKPQTFSGRDDRCPVLTEEAFGRAFDLPNLEVLIPIYRIAHPAMDTDGRQVGENNVVPRTLFLDLPTQRRVCGYPGSRYQDDLPMNITALKNMTKRWAELLSLTEQFREALEARMPRRDPSTFSAGEMQFHVVCQLAAAAYVMVRGVDPVPNGQLDGGLAAVFRLIDGVRLVTNDILRATPGVHGCDTPVSSQSIADWAEQHAVYRGTFGVCAGPPGLIEEYLRVLFGEAPAPIQVEPNAAARVGDLEAALDYGLLGQRVESAVRYFGASQGLLHERLRVAFEGHTPRSLLQDRVEAPITTQQYPLLRDDYSLVDAFNLEIDVNRWLFARAGEALPGKVNGASLDELMKLDPAAQAASQRRLAEFLAHALPADRAVSEPICSELAAVAADVFALERRCLRVVEREQGKLNERLQRRPGRTLTGADLAAYNRPRNGPPLFSTLAEGLGVSVTTDAASTVVRHEDRSLAFTD